MYSSFKALLISRGLTRLYRQRHSTLPRIRLDHGLDWSILDPSRLKRLWNGFTLASGDGETVGVKAVARISINRNISKATASLFPLFCLEVVHRERILG
ncbi:hypothetical protein RRG08_046913 [Elysia crispata]|uniref:Uncharacterized protein n=1 Tax=Elysia crispata TaxID=231223 RepID=A0AAE0ZHZ4_9GAST|nr:hypothetical protein RRG08_046913 [Elysia crispata]